MPDSLRGQLLIAGRGLRDPNFFRTVVLIVGHGADGAMGVIVNRPSGLTISQALKGLKREFELPETGDLVYMGGPVERNALFVMHNAYDLDGGESPVIDGLFVGNSPETFEQIIERAAEGDPKLQFRVYFGCAGWGPDQLEGELGRNDWLLLPATLDYVFHTDPYGLWERAIMEFRQANPIVPGVGGSPDLN